MLKRFASPVSAGTERLGKAVVRNGGQTVKIEWRDSSAEFLSVFLRDHCPQSVDPDTAQREVDTAYVCTSAPERTMRSADVSRCGNFVHCRYASGHESTFTSEWLKVNAFAAESVDESRTKVLWGSELNLSDVSFDFEEVLTSDSCLMNGLECLYTHGIFHVFGSPTDGSGTDAMAKRVGRIRETLYGRLWDTAPKDVPNDTAYTNIGLPLHTDCTYMRDPPGVQMLHCVSRAHTGGANMFVDGFAVLKTLRETYPEAFEFFCHTPLPFYCIDAPVHLQTRMPVVALSPDDSVDQIRFNNADRGSLSHLSASQVADFYRHWPVLSSLVHSGESVFRHTMDEGEIVLFDNHRVLHGRDAFEGYRNMLGCYFDRDEWESRLRVLQEKHRE